MQLSDLKRATPQDAVNLMLTRYPTLLTVIPNGQCFIMTARFSAICTKLGIEHRVRDAWDYRGPVSPNRNTELWNEEFIDNWNHGVVEIGGLIYDFTAHQYDHTLPVPVIMPLKQFIAMWGNHEVETPQEHADRCRHETGIAQKELADL